MSDVLKTTEYILASLVEPVLILDSTFRATVANPAFCEILGVSPELLEGKKVEELLVDEGGAPHLREVLHGVVANNGHVDQAEIQCITPSQMRKVLIVNARRVRIPKDGPEVIVVALRDITQEKEAADKVEAIHAELKRRGAELEVINRELDTFAHTVSHDLRTPLRLTNRVAHMLLSDHGAGLPEGAAELVKMILTSTEEMAKLIESLLAFSHVSREPLRKKPVDMNRLVQEAADDLRGEYQGRDVKIVVGDLTPFEADRTLLKLAILNLLENALKFTREREVAEIHIGCARIADETVYFIRDNGLGFDLKQAESMFDVFQRLHRTKQIEGSGVGLALVRRIINRHGGRIWADSEPERGATFYFTLFGQSAELLAPIEG